MYFIIFYHFIISHGIDKVCCKKVDNFTNENFLSMPMKMIKKGSTQFVIILHTKGALTRLIFSVLILQIV